MQLPHGPGMPQIILFQLAQQHLLNLVPLQVQLRIRLLSCHRTVPQQYIVPLEEQMVYLTPIVIHQQKHYRKRRILRRKVVTPQKFLAIVQRVEIPQKEDPL